MQMKKKSRGKTNVVCAASNEFQRLQVPWFGLLQAVYLLEVTAWCSCSVASARPRAVSLSVAQLFPSAKENVLRLS